MTDLLSGLNPEQRAAVTATEGNTLVLAGAGSGKTRVLTTRMAWLIQTGQVSPMGVLAVTFTNKAAREMLARLSALLPIDTRSLWIGTFHGLCHRLLRIHHRDAGLPSGFQIIDTQDQLALIKRMLKAANIDENQCPPKPLQWFINHQKEQGLRAKDVIAADPTEQRMVEIMMQYEAQCEREGLVDFAELLLRSLELLRRETAIAHHYQQRFRHILIDEFQDTNKLQYQWMVALRGPQTHLFAVGDDDQSIYAFRGADTANIARYEQEFARGNLIKLEQNYRSVGHVLRSANALIANNHKRLGKNLWTDQGDGERLRIYEAASDTQEAQWIVDETRALSGQEMNWGEVAILYRSNAQSRVLEHALFNAGIPYRVYGGLRFFERQEVKHALAYLRLISNPGDDHAFLRVVNVPPRGIGARSIETLQAAAQAGGISLFEAALGGAAVRGKSVQSLSDFCVLIQQLEQQARFLPLGDLISQMLTRSGLLASYQAEKDATERVENLEELVNAAWAFCAEHGYGADDAANGPPPEGLMSVDADGEVLSTWIAPLHAFLSHAALEAGDNQAQAGQSAVQMMTVHAAKGLEFSAVFVAGLEEGLFPHENSLLEPAGLEEERRLMYVAITRARKRLYLTLSQTRMLHGQTRYNLRSRFLEELPEDSVQWLSPKRYGGDPGLATLRAEGMALPWPQTNGANSSPNTWRRGGQAAAPRVLTHGRLQSPDGRWAVGQTVRHARFGDGVILQFEGMGDDARAQVRFAQAGDKWLALAVAKLEAA